MRQFRAIPAVVEHGTECIVGHAALAPSYREAVVFDPVPHRYYRGQRVIPSVTQILEGTGYIDPRWYTPGSAQRGRDVHKFTCWVDEGTVHLQELVYHRWKGYLVAWEALKLAYGLQLGGIEQIVCDADNRWAGKIDRLADIARGHYRRRLEWQEGDLALLDLKTGRPERWHGLQLEAYRLALLDGLPRGRYRVRKFGAYLATDGTYRVKEYEEDQRGAWCAAVDRYYASVAAIRDN